VITLKKAEWRRRIHVDTPKIWDKACCRCCWKRIWYSIRFNCN